MTARKTLLVAALVVSALQIGFLSWIIAGRAAVLRNGPEVLLKVEPVDPRDLLRGDYVRLGYEIANFPAGLVVNAPDRSLLTEAGPMFVRLGRDADGYWRPRAASMQKPFEYAPPPGAVDLRGTIGSGNSLAPDATLWVDYGLSRYYLPEGAGKPIEADMRTRPFGVVVAVGPDGAGQIKALMDGATLLFEEPLY